MTVKTQLLKDKEAQSQNEETRIQIFSQQMLTPRIFAASYVGRFFTNSLNAYRDVLKIHEGEKELVRDLEAVKKRVDDFYGGMIWTAITGPDTPEAPSGHCIWVTLQHVPFGTYWFMIEDISFPLKKQMVVKVKVLRKFEQDGTSKFQTDDTWISVNWSDLKNNMLNFFRETITWHNTKESVRFLSVLLVAIVTGLIYGLKYFGDYSIRFFREFNNLIKVCTPILLAILDLVSKTIGGFYILLAMLWRGHGQIPLTVPSLKGPPPRPYKAVRSSNRYQGGYPGY